MKVAFSCLVDANPKFEWQAFLWAHSLVRNAAVAPNDIFVHCIHGVSEHFQSTIRGLGAQTVEVGQFDGGHAYCNKIQQCFSGAFAGYDRAVLTDCDLFFLSLPDLRANATLAANVVGLANPPLPLLQDIYRRAGVAPSEMVPVELALSRDELTFASNLNGGFYSIDVTALPRIAERWRKHALWLIGEIAALGTYTNHVDQVALALTLDELGISPARLDPGANFHVHVPPERLSAAKTSRIDVLHYHSRMEPSGRIPATGVPFVDVPIARANAGIEAIVSSDFDNALFWNWRYDRFPELGSGLGSRGDILEQKRELLGYVTASFNDKSVLDVGCGDLETTRTLPLKRYLGMDLSQSALKIAESKRPDWQFVTGSLSGTRDDPRADLVICLDVLIHQKSRADYDRLTSALIACANERLIVSGYEAPPALSSSIVGFHEPLSQTLKKSEAFTEILPIGTYRDVTVFAADKRPAGPARHVSDVPGATFEAMLPLVRRKDLLLAMMDMSREHLGFFTKTSIRMAEYPWMYEKLLAAKPQAHVLDVGAGVSPLPIALARRGARVDCVDAHPRVMHVSRRHEWNEWGFLDYAQIDPSIRSFHTDIMTYQPDEPYDIVYSLSVIEHMPRPVWEGTLDRAAAWLKPGGTLLLTLDLVPGTFDLWNRSEGAIVDRQDHGTIDDIARRIARGGLSFDEAFIVRSIPDSRTDVAFIVAKK